MQNKIDLEGRRQRGLLIAQRSKIRKTERGWRVPSQTKHTYYIVRYNMLNGQPTCTCPDHQELRCKCKHIWAVLFTTQVSRDEQGNTVLTKSVKLTYSQDWSAYTKAQQNEKPLFLKLLNNLCETIEEPQYVFGRPRMSMRDMVFSSALKVYTTFSLRRFTADMKEAETKGYIKKSPYYTTVSRYMENPELTPIIQQMIQLSSLPLRSVETDFAVDSSGFSTSQFGRWFDFKYGKDQLKRLWIKAHLCVGVKTNIVTAVKLTHGYHADSKVLPELVRTTAENFDMKEVSADKAYSSRYNFREINDLGADAYIPFRSNASLRASKSRIWKKMLHLFLYNQEEFAKHYHKRSNVETSFYMIKTKFGTQIRSRKEVSQINEVLLKVLCHNICVLIHEMHELGIDVKFG